MSERQPGLVYANFQVTCGCEHRFATSFIGLQEGDAVPCPNCQADVPIEGEVYDEMQFQFVDGIIAAFKKAGAEPPGDLVIDFIQKYNRLPSADDLRRTKGYAVALVGEEHFQASIFNCAIGEPVTLAHEIGNPHDPLAIVAIDQRGQVIGYVGRKNFVRKVVHDQGLGCQAEIFRFVNERGFTEVVLDVSVSDAATVTRAYSRMEEML